MAGSIFDGWIGGSSGSFQPSGSGNWNDFYGSILGSGVGSPSLQAFNKVASGADSVGKGASWDNFKSIFGVKDTNPSTGNPILDFFFDGGKTKVDPNEIANPAQSTATGEETLSAGDVDWSEWLARGAIVVLGFIFVAVGLAMFGRPVLTGVTKAVSG